MQGTVLVTGCALGLAAWLTGCNVFAPFAPDNPEQVSYETLIGKGNAAVNRGDYAAAEDYFRRAQAKNPSGSEAFLFHAKAVMALYGMDYTTFNKEFDVKQSGQENGIPFLDPQTTIQAIDSVYHPVFTAVKDLEHILRSREDTLYLSDDRSKFLPPDGDTASDGKVSAGVARLDLGLLQALKAMLAPLDMDGNGRIDSACGRNVCPLLAPACLTGEDYRRVCPQGPLSEARRFESFKKLTEKLNIDELNSDDLDARHVSTNPNDINGFLDAMAGPIAGSNRNLGAVNNALASHQEEELRAQIEDIVGSINDLDHFLGYMRYDDSLDNDHDRQSPAPPTRQDIMIWHDYNRDGNIRFDYDAQFPGFPALAGDLGHPLHRHLRPELYLTATEWRAGRPEVAADSSENSLVNLMVRFCQDRVAELPVAGAVTQGLKDTLADITCRTVSPLLRPEVSPPARSDWISGVFGVDEEMLDERDNDLDGLRDEDGRNSPGMDDDDDGNLTTDLIGQPIVPMQWRDAPNHANSCPDIDTARAMNPQNPRQFCIGSLEHRLHLARSAPDSLMNYYSRFPGEGSNEPCLDDIEKLDPEFLKAQAYTEEEKSIACRHKHIWVAQRPPRSEWSDGIFGVDEEYADGIDNDGDGWIDEDLK